MQIVRTGRGFFYADPLTGRAPQLAIAARSEEQWRVDEAKALHDYADLDRGLALTYFIGGGEGPVKIGYSIDVQGRLRTLREHSPIPLGLLATARGGRRREEAYHAQFAHLRLHGEWFERAPEVLAEITRLSA